MAASMSPKLQKTFENTWAYEMNQQLKEMFQAKASKERLDVVKSLMACKPKPGASICAFVLEIKGYFDRLESLNMAFDAELSINIILSGLSADYNQFVLSYQMNGKETSIMELYSLLQIAEQVIKKSDVPSTSAALVLDVEVDSEIAPTCDPKEAVCFYCNTKGHWKRSCPKYLKDLKDGKVENGGHSGMFMIELYNTTTSDSWVLDTGCGTHICTVLQGLKESRKLKHGELNLVMGNRKITPVTKIGKYQNEVENQLGRKIKVLRSDRGGEYLSIEFFDHLKNCGIVSQLSPPRTPQLNGVAERRNRTLLDMVRSMMCRATLPIKSIRYLFTKRQDNVVFSSRGMFPEREMISKEDSGSKIDLEEIQESADEEPIVNTDTQQEVVTPVEPDDISLPIRRTSSRVSKPSQDPQFYYGFHIEEDKISDSTLSELDEPANYKEAMASPKAAKWKEAIKSKIQSMYDNQVWNLVDTTTGLKMVGCKWIFKKKTDMDGKVHTYKARLVAKGYTQTHMIDYEETFSPVAKIKSIRIMLAIATFHDYEIWQMDVKTAFLNGKPTEDVFMAQPEGFENAKYPKRVCKLQKAIYGLKQASRSWNLCFHEKVTQFGFSRSEDESCIYVKISGSIVVFLVLYVDDILLIGNDIPTLQSVKDWLGKCFAMKDLGDAAYILGIKIYRDRSKRLIGLSQDTYLDKILKRFKMDNSKKGNLPLHHGIKISSDLCPKTNDELDKMSRVPYASAIGSIMYAMTCTRPDVSFALSMVSRHQQNPGEGHWTAVKNILKYLRNTKDRFLVYGGEKELRVTGYCDADTVVDSTCKFEYIAACEASKEAIWMKGFIRDLGVVPTVQDPIEIFCDNESAVTLTKEPKDHGKSKHIDKKYHFVRSKVAEGHVIVKDVRSEDNSADPFTKALAKSKHDEHAWSIGLKDKIKF
ncbi:putative RNA-directed DNA polymerase [Tanacetum coccineum]